MPHPQPTQPDPNLARATHPALTGRLGLPTAVALNMMEMIGVGPFVTLPIILAAAGARFSAWAWILGAFIALCDGLVWAELGATFPDAGGSYAFLRQLYHPRRAGRWISFLYVWQLSFSAPLSIASGCLGVAAFTVWLWPALAVSIPLGLFTLHATSLIAALACLLVTFLLYRNLTAITRLAWILFFGVLLTIAGVIASGAVVSARIHPAPTFASLLGWPTLALVPALAQATLIACYDYWGYYNICFLGSEVRNPQRTIPRAILLSLAFVAVIYLAMNFALLPALHSGLLPAHSSERLALVAELARTAFGSTAARILASLVLWSALASVFSLLLGYSRVPWAAARDGNFFSFLDALHPRHGFPHRSLIALGLTATLFCFFSLGQVIALLVVIRILLQFLLQHVGLLALRRHHPELPRPFRMPLYPLPVLAAIAGFLFILAFRPHPLTELAAAAAIALSGSAIYLLRARKLHQWPFPTP